MNIPKFKNAIGEDLKKQYLNCSVTTISTEGRYLAVNENFLALSWSNLGEIVVVDSTNFSALNPDQPRLKGHRANVLDLEFSPFSSNLLAASFDDSMVLLYKIPEGGLTEHITQEVQIYQNHIKKVPFVTFNPIASDVICSGAFLGDIHIWNVLKGETYVELKADEIPTCIQWNPNGTLVGATTKKKNINIFDPRANKIILNHLINESFQSAKFSWVNENQFVTTSWTKNKAKMMKLWDIRKVKDDLSSEGELTSIKIDSSTTITTPFVDKESKLIYAIAKGESIIRTYDYSSGNFIKGIDFSSTEPSISTVMFERKCLDYNRLEIDRFAKYVNSRKVYYISYTIPRRNPGYDPNLYPPVDCGEAALSYEDWISGKNAEPIKKEINTIENKFVSKIEKVEEVKKPEIIIKELEEKIAEMSFKIKQLTKENEIDKLKIELKEEKDNNKKLENIINELKQKYDKEKEKHNKEIENYMEKIKKMIENIQNLTSENINLKDEIKSYNTQNNSDEIVRLYKKIEDLNEKLKRYPFILEKDEKILSVIFTSSSINYSMVCKNTDTLNKLEAELYQKYPELSETNNNFICKGMVVGKFKKFEELKIKNGDIIMIDQN